MINVNKIGLYLCLALGRKEVIKRVLREALKMWLQSVFTGLLPLLSLLSIKPYVSLKCKNIKLENLLRKILLFPIISADQTLYWKVH